MTSAPPVLPLTGLSRSGVILLTLAGATVVALGMSSFRSILAPVLFTLVLGIVANPLRTWIVGRGLPRGLGTIAVILVVVAGLSGFFLVLTIAGAQFLTLLPQYTDELDSLVANFGVWLSSLGIGTDQVETITAGLDPGAILTWGEGLLGGVFGLVGGLVIIVSMLIVMAADATYIPTVLKQLGDKQAHLVKAIGGYAVNVRRYMVVTALLGLAQGFLNTTALLIMQVPGAVLWGIVAFVCSFIPNIGYFIAIIPPVVFGLLVGGVPVAIAVIVIYAIINAIIQTVIQPRVLRTAVSLSQTITFFSVLFWAAVLGPMGAILAVPLTLLARAILIDSNPSASYWAPALGDIKDTKVLLRDEDAAAKAERATAKAQRSAAKTGSLAKKPSS